ncbi:tyrosine-type recombinase/integrase [Rhodanobacter glycinis]|uniref:Tyrosine-type recombinase/integrase n=1 Tax=Rhodanobacter glycinis TaxID=582702 RepID=A0A5B9E3K5_9GAMM|nr:site-specific integrase [Rhodanobacter glycinis]QEE24786.1 tyrosine-type recombinase/integrase [Rhodanobacter glycinis]
MADQALTITAVSALPAALSGAHGANRAPLGTPRQIAADTDVAAISVWLAEYVSSPHTFRSYRKEAERLLVWATQWRGKAISSLAREDVLAYEAFLTNPPAAWCDDALARRGDHRRLFAGPLSDRSRRQALGILAGLFNYLVRAGYLAGSPFALQPRRLGARKASHRVERFIDRALWLDVLAQLDRWPRQTSREQQRYERARWVLRLLYETALRASEAAQAREADLYQVRGRWWLRVVGKGGIEGQIPWSDALMGDLQRYRSFLGLPAMPETGGRCPLILGIAGRGGALTPTAIYLIVKDIFGRVADDWEAGDSARAAQLRRVSTHWLRHTAASHQADDGNPIHHIQKNLRHSSIATTSIYLHAEDDARHAATTERNQRSEA